MDGREEEEGGGEEGPWQRKFLPCFPFFPSRPSGSGTEAVCPSHLPPRPDCRAKNQFGDGGGREKGEGGGLSLLFFSQVESRDFEGGKNRIWGRDTPNMPKKRGKGNEKMID